MPGLSQLTTAFAVGARVVLLNYLLARDVVRSLRRRGDHRLSPACRRFGSNLPSSTGPRRPRAPCAILPIPAATCRALRSSGCERRCQRRSPISCTGLPRLFDRHISIPAEVDRRPDSIGKAIPNAEILVVRPNGELCDAGRGRRVGASRRAGVDWDIGTILRRTALRFRPAPGQPQRDLLCPRSPSGRATACGAMPRDFSISSAGSMR